MIDLKKEAARLDHTVVRDPGGMGGDDRWTCTACGMAILRAGVVVSGSAATTWCPGITVAADDSGEPAVADRKPSAEPGQVWAEKARPDRTVRVDAVSVRYVSYTTLTNENGEPAKPRRSRVQRDVHGGVQGYRLVDGNG